MRTHRAGSNPVHLRSLVGVRLTRLGWYHVLLTLGLGVAAIRTGNNLLYLVLGMFLGILLANGVLQTLNLSGLVVERIVPKEVTAYTPYLVTLRLRNTKRLLPSFGVTVEDLSSLGPLGQRCYYFVVRPSEASDAAYRHALVSRGWFQLLGVVVASSFPFGLVRRKRFLPLEDAILGLPLPRPAPLPAPRWPFHRMGSLNEPTRARELPRTLRPFLPGDEIRDVHHKASAHLGRLVVREFEAPAGRRIVVLLDEALELREGESYATAREAAERAISHASYAVGRLLEQGYQVALVARLGSLPPGSGPAHFAAAQRLLATLSPAQAQDTALHLHTEGEPVLLVDRDGVRWLAPGRMAA